MKIVIASAAFRHVFALGLCLAGGFVSMPALAAEWVGFDLDGVRCEGGSQGFGPFDYHDIDQKTDPLYEEGRFWEINKVHTNRAVNAMKAGQEISTANYQMAAADLDYTLRAIPNEPRALQEIIRLDSFKRSSVRRLPNRIPSPECYFQRAIAFRADKPYVYMLYGIYLYKRGYVGKAIDQFSSAIDIDSENAEAHYNLGLAYFKEEKYEESLSHAKKSYALGYPLPGLGIKLMSKGFQLEVED